jgi:hypothetical protein
VENQPGGEPGTEHHLIILGDQPNPLLFKPPIEPLRIIERWQPSATLDIPILD